MTSYRERTKKKEEVKGHNHPFSEKCDHNCPRNEHYKPDRKPDLWHRKKR